MIDRPFARFGGGRVSRESNSPPERYSPDLVIAVGGEEDVGRAMLISIQSSLKMAGVLDSG